MLKKSLVQFNFIELLVWEVRCGEHRSRLCRQSKRLSLLSFEETAYTVRIENFIASRNAQVSIETIPVSVL